MTYRPEPKGSMKAYLQQRSVADRIAEAATITTQHIRSVAWLREYHATRSRKTAFNWSPSITVTKPEETTSEEIHHQESQAAEVGIAEGVGDAPEGEARGSIRDGEDADVSVGSLWAREGHTDFGDGDTPF